MQKKEWRRNVVIGCVVAAIFFGWWLRGFLYSNWKFRLFSRRSWSYIASEFEAGWMLSSASDWIFLVTLLLAVPSFLYIWYLSTKVRWRKSAKKAIKTTKAFVQKILKQKIKKKSEPRLAPPPPPEVSFKTEKPSGLKRPKAIGSSMPMSAAPVVAAQPVFSGSATATSTAASRASSSGFESDFERDFRSDFQAPSFESSEDTYGADDFGEDIANMPLESIELPTREPVVEDVPALFENAGYQLIKEVKLGRLSVDFLAVAADKIYAVLMDKAAGDWLAEEEPFNGEAPLWFSEVDHRVSPIYELKQETDNFQKQVQTQLPNMLVKPFFVEEKGNIINAEEMLRIWKELDVTVARTDVGGTEDLATTAEVVKAVTPASESMVSLLTQILQGGENK